MNSRSLIVLVILVLAVVGVSIWFLQSAPPPAVPDFVKATPAKVEKSPLAVAPSPAATPRPQAPVAEAKPAAPTPQMTEWENRIHAVLTAHPDNTEGANTATAQMLINLLPTLPPEGQSEAAQHIANLLDDSEYSRIAGLVKNPQMPEEVLDLFFTDLMNREDPVKLPMILEIAKIPGHPHQEEAKNDLELFLEEDYGTDWAKWDAALKAYLKKQAEDEAPQALIKPGAQ